MIDERAYELLCCQLGLANEEKAGLCKQINELITRLKTIEESNKENSKALVNTINEFSVTVRTIERKMELLRKQLEAKDEVNRILANEISNLRLQLEDSKKHRFGRTSEQRRLDALQGLWVDALASDRTTMDIIDLIGDMFRNEEMSRTMKLSGGKIKEKRLKLTGPILERIHHKVIMMMQVMANEQMRKAVNYTINQWKSLRNILKDGTAEKSNNLCEQRMKPVKLLFKNCMNNIFSLIESCKLNDIGPQDYLKHLFECILHGKDCDKKSPSAMFL